MRQRLFTANRKKLLIMLVNSICQKIQRGTSVNDTLQTAIREVGLALGVARVSQISNPAATDRGVI